MTASSTANGFSVADSVDPPGFDLASTRPGDEKRDHEAILHNLCQVAEATHVIATR